MILLKSKRCEALLTDSNKYGMQALVYLQYSEKLSIFWPTVIDTQKQATTMNRHNALDIAVFLFIIGLTVTAVAQILF